MKDLNLVFLNHLMKEDILTAVETVTKDIVNCPFDIQITVADNSGNQDGVKESLAEKFPQVRYIDCGGNIGFAAGNNVGFKSEPARYYFALNPDTQIPENSRTIERIISFMDAHPKIGAIGPKLLNTDGTLQHTCYRFDLKSILIKPFRHINWDLKYDVIRKFSDRLLMKNWDHNSTRPVDWVLGAAIVVRGEVVKEIGWFDDRYFMYLEDADWCRNMWEHGWPVYYVHDIVIVHRHERESSKVPGVFKALIKNKLSRIHAMSWLKYLWKWRKTHKYYEPIS